MTNVADTDRESIRRRALLAIGHHAPRFEVAGLAVAIVSAVVGLWGSGDVLTTYLTRLCTYTVLLGLVLVPIAARAHRRKLCWRDRMSIPGSQRPTRRQASRMRRSHDPGAVGLSYAGYAAVIAVVMINGFLQIEYVLVKAGLTMIVGGGGILCIRLGIDELTHQRMRRWCPSRCHDAPECLLLGHRHISE